MDIAIQLLMPIGLGLLLGQWLNRQWHVSLNWMPLFAVVGMVLGLINVYRGAQQRFQGGLPAPPEKKPSSLLTHQDLKILHSECKKPKADSDILSDLGLSAHDLDADTPAEQNKNAEEDGEKKDDA